MSKVIKTSGREIEASYDVVVIGGGLAGVCAAIAAARHNSKTAIVQDRPVFGGNSSSEIRVPIGGANNCCAWARETGIIEEICIEDRVRNHDRIGSGTMNSIWDMVLYEKVKAEVNLTAYLNTVAKGVEMENDNKIAAVICHQLGSERTLKLKADYFIDCTGDGTVGAAAGAFFRMGRESMSEFGESLAPEDADDKVQGSSLMFRAKDAGHPVKFEPPPWAESYPTEESLYKRHHRVNKKDFGGYWWIEVGAPFNTIDQNEEIRDEALRHLLGVWDHIKNQQDHGAQNMVLDWIGVLPGKRESRRLVGDYILTENDIRDQKLFYDRIAYGGWFIDIHTMGGILAKDKPPEAMSGDPNLSDQLRIELYSIPYRCLYSKNIENLFMAGRDISVTHVALGTTRLMLTCALLGQAVGTAASLCLKNNSGPRGLFENHIEKLQQTLLKDDCFIPEIKNQDPDDLALNAEVSASSSAPLSLEPTDNLLKLESHRAQVFPLICKRLETISLHLQSSRSSDTELTVGFLPATDIWHFNDNKSKEAIVSKAVVPAGYKGWVDFQINAETSEELYLLEVHACEQIAWTSSTPLPGVASAYKRKGWKRWTTQRAVGAMRLDPQSYPFGPENLTNGVARPEKQPNIWISDPDEPLPQSVTLNFGKEAEFNEVYLTFDTNLHFDFRRFPPFYKIPECVSDYEIQIAKDDAFQTILTVEGNYQRRRIHRFETVSTDKLRLQVQKTNGVSSARVYEIRVYNT